MRQERLKRHDIPRTSPSYIAEADWRVTLGAILVLAISLHVVVTSILLQSHGCATPESDPCCVALCNTVGGGTSCLHLQGDKTARAKV
jgi:hypothetical protein